MAQTIDFYNQTASQQVSPIYDEQTTGVNTQVEQAKNDPYYSELLKGLEATKNREFTGIEGRAAARGALYSTAPTQQQSAFLGEKYMPAVAEVKRTQQERINKLQEMLADIRTKKAQAISERAYGLYQTDVQKETALESARIQAAAYQNNTPAATDAVATAEDLTASLLEAGKD
jgi:hypothetical protein